MIPATQTLALINQMIEKDQGGKFRQTLEKIIPKMDDAYRGEEEPFRNHLGASLIGRECSRSLWYSYHWASKKSFEGRMLRLFNRGHLEEARFLALLIATGFEVWYEKEDGGQFRITDLYGHFGSALDGVVRGIPEIPSGAAAYAEFKTHNDKSFQKLKANGVEMEKYEHYAQMQVCMRKMDLPYGLYMAVNKNDDELWAEIIELDPKVGDYHINDKAEMIIFASDAPPKISDSPGWWKCKWCDEHSICHGKTVPEINCRTCAHSTPTRIGDGSWDCAKGCSEIHTDQAMYGCSLHVFNPHMLNGVTFHGGNKEGTCTDISLPDGTRLLQGPTGVTSQQLKERGL